MLQVFSVNTLKAIISDPCYNGQMFQEKKPMLATKKTRGFMAGEITFTVIFALDVAWRHFPSFWDLSLL